MEKFLDGIKETRGHHCQCCKREFSVHDLHGHHIRKRHEYPGLRKDPDNILVLCQRCHDYLEQLPVEEQLKHTGHVVRQGRLWAPVVGKR